MTIAVGQTGTYTRLPCNGVTIAFNFPNKIFAASDLVVNLIDTLGVLYPFVAQANIGLGLSYVVNNVDTDTGASITMNIAPTNGWSIDLRTLVPEIQTTSIKNQGQFLPELHEEFFDRATRMLQDLYRLNYQFGIHGPDIENTVWPALPNAAGRKSMSLLFDLNGLPTVGVPVGIALVPGQYRFVGTDSGAANAYIVAVTGAIPVTLTVGALVSFNALNGNTGASTANIGGTGAQPVLSITGAALTGGDLLTTGPTWVQWTGAAWQIVGTGTSPDKVRTAGEILAAVVPTNYFFGALNVRRYGAALNAVWNGATATGTDDTAAFNNAIKAASAAGGGEVTFDGPTIVKNVTILSYVTLRGIGNPTAYLNAGAPADVHFNVQGLAGAGVPITNAVPQYGQLLNVANTGTFSVGQYVVVQTTGTSVPVDYVFYGGSALYPTSNGRKQQIARVASIVLNTSVTIDTGLGEAYPLVSGSVGGAQVCPLNPVTYANATGAVIGWRIRDFSARVSIGNNGGGVQNWYGVDFRIENLFVQGASGYPALRSIQSAFGEIRGNRITDCQQVGSGATTGIAHDIIESSHNIEVHDNILSYLTEDEIAMRTHDCQFHHNSYLNAFDSGINTHGNSNYNIDITDNDIVCPNSSAGIAIGYNSNRTTDSNITVARNRISGSGGKGISVTSQPFTITAITAANPAVVTINTVSGTNPINVNDVLTITAVTGMVQINGLRTTVTAVGGVSGAWTFTTGINSAAFTAYGAAGVAARAPQNVKILDNTILGYKVTSGATSAGISCQYSDDLDIRGNTLDGATIGSAPDAGISLVSCTRARVSQNLSKNNTAGYGFQFVNCAGFDCGPNQGFNNQNQFNTSGSSGDCRIHDHQSDTTTNSIENNTPPTVRTWNSPWDGYPSDQKVTVPYTSGVTMFFDASLGKRFELTVTDAVIPVIGAPLNAPTLGFAAKRISLTIRNTSGGAMGAPTFSSAFKMAAFVAPATANSRTIEWEWNGANWIQMYQTAADVPN